MIVIGLISGTSFDAIEGAAAKLDTVGDELTLTPLGARSRPYDDALRTAIASALPPAPTSAEEICRLDTLIGQAFAEAAASVNRELCDGRAEVIVSHGQTLFHWVEGGKARGTLQLGQPAWIAERTNVPVVSDLRSRDVAAGGHGAPLVAMFDALVLAGSQHRRAAVNLGGIANVTIVDPSGEAIAYDTGPGNALIDSYVGHVTQGADRIDNGGERAGRGRVVPALLRSLLGDPYFGAPAPKSTGKELFNLSFVKRALDPLPDLSDDDVVATLTELTALTVARELEDRTVADAVVSGGGVLNDTLMLSLQRLAPSVRVVTTEEWGIAPSAKEAYAFALLGYLTLHGLPGTISSCTGASHESMLGTIVPGRAPLVLPAPFDRPPSKVTIAAEEAITQA